MNVKETFLKLTSQTYPHGKEHELFDKLPQNLEVDSFGNLFIKIGDSDVMFTSHLDTATSASTEVVHEIDGSIIKTNGKSILGADDKAGVTIMLYMIERNIPGLYYFFLGEEVGCLGSKDVSEKHKIEKLPYITKVVSFDRRGLSSVITFQASSRCCSDKFGEALAAELNRVEASFSYKNDPTGIYTDSAQFTKIYPECTNISVGYYNEHTFSEKQDIDHLTKLAEACCLVNWTSLPVERDPSKVEYGGYSRYSYGGYSWDDEYDYDYGWASRSSYNNTTYKSAVATKNKVWFHDEEYNYVSSFEVDTKTGDIVSIDLHKSRLIEEEADIYEFLSDLEIDYERITWDGMVLKVFYYDGRTTESSREELEDYDVVLDLKKIAMEKEKSEKKEYLGGL